MAIFGIPCSLREHTAGQSTVAVEADDLAAALKQLAELHPACAERLLDAGGNLREWVRVLQDGREISIVPAVSGG